MLERGTVKLFGFRGIEVFLHWSWLLIAVVSIQLRKGAHQYESIVWNVVEYLSLFLIVLLHEFGHALACRSVGGKADRIVLWPLGGVAYVAPPQRPGATLWSIAAGPLVNLVLVPVTFVLFFLNTGASHDVAEYFKSLAFLNLALLIFNCLPIYPLDGGQMLRSLLWFVIGRARSLQVASIIGLVGAVGGAVLAFMWRSPWLAVLAAYAGMRAYAGIRQAKVIDELMKLPVHAGFTCPSCQEPPPVAATRTCACGAPSDPFASDQCMHCGRFADYPICLHCGRADSPRTEWRAQPKPAPR